MKFVPGAAGASDGPGGFFNAKKGGPFGPPFWLLMI
jgi:hypothetical protein